MDIVYLNDKFLNKEKATISVMDRGFLFGDGVYEVIPVYNHKPFLLEQHLDRLNHSLSSIRLSYRFNYAHWQKIFAQLIKDNVDKGPNQSLYLQVTRGAATERNHAFPINVEPTILAFTSSLRCLPYETLSQGMSALTLPDIRWQHCNIKATALLANILLYQEALDHQCVEAILIREGLALEGATSNLFIVEGGTIKTPPLSNFILGGVTRNFVLELARKHEILVQECPITETQLLQADEIWITSSTREIYPIIKINDLLINHGKPGGVWKKMITHYREHIKNL